jgi:hypothetical protein
VGIFAILLLPFLSLGLFAILLVFSRKIPSPSRFYRSIARTSGPLRACARSLKQRIEERKQRIEEKRISRTFVDTNKLPVDLINSLGISNLKDISISLSVTGIRVVKDGKKQLRNMCIITDKCAYFILHWRLGKSIAYDIVRLNQIEVIEINTRNTWLAKYPFICIKTKNSEILLLLSPFESSRIIITTVVTMFQRGNTNINVIDKLPGSFQSDWLIQFDKENRQASKSISKELNSDIRDVFKSPFK